MELRAGGKIDFLMKGPDGAEYPMVGRYEEIVPLEKLVFSSNIHDGNDVLTTVTFEDRGRKTLVSVTQVYTMESAATRGAPQGWSESLDRLTALLASSSSTPKA